MKPIIIIIGIVVVLAAWYSIPASLTGGVTPCIMNTPTSCVADAYSASYPLDTVVTIVPTESATILPIKTTQINPPLYAVLHQNTPYTYSPKQCWSEVGGEYNYILINPSLPRQEQLNKFGTLGSNDIIINDPRIGNPKPPIPTATQTWCYTNYQTISLDNSACSVEVPLTLTSSPNNACDGKVVIVHPQGKIIDFEGVLACEIPKLTEQPVHFNCGNLDVNTNLGALGTGNLRYDPRLAGVYKISFELNPPVVNPPSTPPPVNGTTPPITNPPQNVFDKLYDSFVGFFTKMFQLLGLIKL